MITAGIIVLALAVYDTVTKTWLDRLMFHVGMWLIVFGINR